jgi:hypothetical protein
MLLEVNVFAQSAKPNRTASDPVTESLLTFEQFQELRYDQKLIYLQFVSSLLSLFEISRGDIKDVEFSKYSMRSPSMREKTLNELFSLLVPTSEANKADKIKKLLALFSPRTAASTNPSEEVMALAKEPVRIAGGQFQQVLSRVSDGYKEMSVTSPKTTKLVKGVATLGATETAWLGAEEVLSSDEQNEVDRLQGHKTANQLVTEEQEKINQEMNGGIKSLTADQKSTAPAGTSYARKEGAICIFGNTASRYILSPKGKLICEAPKGRINSKNCRGKAISPSYECPSFGLSNSVLKATVSKELCVPLFQNKSLNNLSLSCSMAFNVAISKVPMGIDPEEYNKAIALAKSQIEQFMGNSSSKMSLRDYCLGENVANGKNQQNECAGIVSMYQVLDKAEIKGPKAGASEGASREKGEKMAKEPHNLNILPAPSEDQGAEGQPAQE